MPKAMHARPALRGPLPLPEGAVGAAFSCDGETVNLTHLTKPYFPDGATKRDLLDYNHDVAEFLLPYLRDRPYTMKRYPDGIDAPPFFQKEARAPAWVPTVRMPSSNQREHVNFIVVNNTAALLYVVNSGCIDHNIWMSRRDTPLSPDFILIDLDPGPRAGFALVIRVAQALRKVLDKHGIEGFPKTSGATGMHVWIPIAPGHTFPQSQQFAALLLRMAAQAVPEAATEVWGLRRRPQDKVYLDFRQNAHGKTIPPPYSPRPHPGAPVSAPLRWDEVKAGLDPSKFTIRSMRRRLERVGDLFAGTLPNASHASLQTLLRRLDPAA